MKLTKTSTDLGKVLAWANLMLQTGKPNKSNFFRILNDLQAQNGSTLGDLQSELTENPDLLIILG